MSGLSVPAVFAAVDLAQVVCVYRRVTSLAVGGRRPRFLPFELISAYVDDHATQCRTVVEIGVTLGATPGTRSKARDKQMILRVAHLRGFDAKENRWGHEGHESENLPWDETMPYAEAFAYAGKLLALAQSDAFAEYENTGTYYRRRH